jgi:hypothetical protein
MTSELMLKAALLVDALETLTLAVATFFTASVTLTLFPTGTVPNDTEDGEELREDACALHVAKATANRASKKVLAYRRAGPPGWGLFKKVCWATLEKRLCATEYRVL